MTDMHLALVRAVVAPENLAVIEADLRERIARDIEAACRTGDRHGVICGWCGAAARIAREATP